jgi:hypothetical protein
LVGNSGNITLLPFTNIGGVSSPRVHVPSNGDDHLGASGQHPVRGSADLLCGYTPPYFFPNIEIVRAQYNNMPINKNINTECAKYFLPVAFMLAIVSAAIETYVFHNYDTHRNSAFYNFITWIIISPFMVLPIFVTHLLVIKSFRKWLTKISSVKFIIVEIISGFGILFVLIPNNIVSWGFHDGMGIFGVIYLMILAYILYFLLFLIFRLLLKTDDKILSNIAP